MHNTTSAKRGQPHNAGPEASSPKRQRRRLPPQTFSTPNQDHNSELDDFADFDVETLDPAILKVFDEFEHSNHQLGDFGGCNEFYPLLDDHPGPSPGGLQDRSSRSCTEDSTHSSLFDVPRPSVETSRASTPQWSTDTSIAEQAQHTISWIRDQILKCQNDPVWSEMPSHIQTRLTARLSSIVENCSVSLTPRPKTEPSTKMKTKPFKAAASRCSRRSNPDLWFAKLVRIHVAALAVPDAVHPYLDQPSSAFLAPPAVMTACALPESKSLSEPAQHSILAKRVAYMQTLSASSIHHSILININCLFFFLLSHESLDSWTTKSHNAVAKKLWHNKLPSLFAMLHPGELATQAAKDKKYKDFTAQVRDWQKRGAKLAHFAQQVGFGAIVLLHEQLEKPFGLSRGLEPIATDGFFANQRPSEVAFRYLLDGGIRDVGDSTGATRFVQSVLVELFRGFDEWKDFGGEAGFPGFDQVEG